MSADQQTRIPCLHCPKLFPKNSLQQHTKAAHHIDTFPCKKSGNYLGSTNALAIHENKNHPVKPQKKGKKQKE